MNCRRRRHRHEGFAVADRKVLRWILRAMSVVSSIRSIEDKKGEIRRKIRSVAEEREKMRHEQKNQAIGCVRV